MIHKKTTFVTNSDYLISLFRATMYNGQTASRYEFSGSDKVRPLRYITHCTFLPNERDFGCELAETLEDMNDSVLAETLKGKGDSELCEAIIFCNDRYVGISKETEVVEWIRLNVKSDNHFVFAEALRKDEVVISETGDQKAVMPKFIYCYVQPKGKTALRCNSQTIKNRLQPVEADVELNLRLTTKQYRNLVTLVDDDLLKIILGSQVRPQVD